MNKSDIIICVDMDDTIENLLDAWVAALNKKYHLNVKASNVTDWALSKSYPTLTADQIFEPLFDNDFWYTVQPKADAITYLKKLVDEQYQVYICTNAHYKTVLPKVQAIIKRYFSCIDWKHLIITYNKHLINCDIMIDDAPHNLQGNNCLKLLFNASHNQNYLAEFNDMIRVYSWEEIYDIVSKYSSGKLF